VNPQSTPSLAARHLWTRRAWLAASVAGLVTAGCSRRGAAILPGTGETLRILLPAGFFADLQHANASNLVRDDDTPMHVLTEFENKSDIKTDITSFSSNEDLLRLLLADDADYDVAMLPAFAAKRLQAMGWLAPLSRAEIPNLKGVDTKKFRLAFDPDLTVTVPYFWSVMGIAYNLDHVDSLPMSWGDFFARNWKRDFSKLNVALFDNGPVTLATALIYMGKSPETANAQEIEAAGKLIGELRGHAGSLELRMWQKLAAGSVHLALALSGDVARAMRTNHRVRFALPREGSILAISSLVALRSPAERRALAAGTKPGEVLARGKAAKFIDYMLQPEVVARLTNLSNFATTVPAARTAIARSITHGAAYFSSATGLDSHLDRIDEATLSVYNRVWRDVRSQWD